MPFFFPTGTVDLSNCLFFNSLSFFGARCAVLFPTGTVGLSNCLFFNSLSFFRARCATFCLGCIGKPGLESQFEKIIS